MRAAALAAACVALGLSAAAAQTARPAPLAGEWAFETGTFNGSCKLRGRLYVEPPTRRGTHACRLVAFETCPDLSVRADQTCTITRSGEEVRISSRVVTVAPDVSYAPDDFVLTMQDPVTMTGELRSFSTAPARFYRPSGAPIS